MRRLLSHKSQNIAMSKVPINPLDFVTKPVICASEMINFNHFDESHQHFHARPNFNKQSDSSFRFQRMLLFLREFFKEQFAVVRIDI